ncbi:hypothetical protein GF374_03555 [Candidatus Woesearchaeota archaeon]|nr:hypothetical protein [Candidatus Woesearchaeota archaeon]
MRYIKPEWFGDSPTDKEVFHYLNDFLGTMGVVKARVRVEHGVVRCSNTWLDRVRGALALRWQFRASLSGTKKGLTKSGKNK